MGVLLVVDAKMTEIHIIFLIRKALNYCLSAIFRKYHKLM